MCLGLFFCPVFFFFSTGNYPFSCSCPLGALMFPNTPLGLASLAFLPVIYQLGGLSSLRKPKILSKLSEPFLANEKFLTSRSSSGINIPSLGFLSLIMPWPWHGVLSIFLFNLPSLPDRDPFRVKHPNIVLSVQEVKFVTQGISYLHSHISKFWARGKHFAYWIVHYFASEIVINWFCKVNSEMFGCNRRVTFLSWDLIKSLAFVWLLYV